MPAASPAPNPGASDGARARVRRTRRDAPPSSDAIFQRLLLAIMEQRLPPGTQLVEQRLAAIFKVSRTKVREAIGRLVHDRIATNIPNRGAFVSSPSVEQARQVFAARKLIEPALVREVARAPTAAQLASLRAHLELERAAQDNADRQRLIALSGEFHFLIADMAGNGFLARTLRELESFTALVITLFGTADHEACPSDHPALVDAIERRDADRAAALMLDHLAHVERSIQLDSAERGPASLEDVFA